MVYIVIVNYGGAVDTIECLQSLMRLNGVRYRVILVDNASPDASLQALTAWLERTRISAPETRWSTIPGETYDYPLRIVASPVNDGFAGGCNIGIREAISDPACSHVWLLNNDTVVEAASLRHLLERAASDDRVGMCGSTLIYHDMGTVIQACGGHFSLPRGSGWALGAMIPRDAVPPTEAIEAELDYVIGASMLVTRDFIETVGLMDERYFLYFEELDWAIRGKSKGFTLAWARDSIVLHKEGSTIGSSTTTRPSDRSIFYMTASYLRIVYAHRKRLLPRAVAVTVSRMAKRLLRGEARYSLMMFKALTAFVRSPHEHGAGPRP